MATSTMDRDLLHLSNFPGEMKDKIMRAIMGQPVTEEQMYHGGNCYENTVTKLHAKGYELIDLNAQETVFTEVWYCKTSAWFGLRTTESAVMLVWESIDSGEQTTLRMWQL